MKNLMDILDIQFSQSLQEEIKIMKHNKSNIFYWTDLKSEFSSNEVNF